MKRFGSAILATMLVLGPVRFAWADDSDAKAVIDKAVNALGGRAKLTAAKAITWKTKGKLTLDETDHDFTTRVIAQSINHYRYDYEFELNGLPSKGVTVLDGNQAWQKRGAQIRKLQDEPLANEKRAVYLLIVPEMPSLLAAEGFKVEISTEENIGGKPAAVLKVTPPDGKDFKLYFDKESGLPVKLHARVTNLRGTEREEGKTFSDYKDFGGIKRATKVVSTLSGKKFVSAEVTQFKVLDKVDPKAFEEPQAD
jgi:hypothetical protein